MRSFTVSQVLLFVIALFLGCTKPNTIDWDKVFGDKDASPDNMVTLDEEEWPDEESPAEETTPPDNDTSEDDEYVAEHDMPEGDDADVATDHVLPTEEDILLSDDAAEVEDTVTDPDFDLMVDETSPWITSTEPESDATDVLVDVIITITFSEALDGAKVTGENILLERSGESVLVAITYRSDDHSVLITPTTPLDHGVAYTVTVRTGITDLAGNALEAEHVFSFVTTLCGNGVPDLGEQCDDGNTDPCDGCLNNCILHTNICGDGYPCEDEECDDGNDDPCDGCLSGSCTLHTSFCGDGYKCGIESCDDGNAVTEKCAYGLTVPNETVCSSSCGNVPCLTTYCGDGITDTNNDEECDDHNTQNTDACKNDCRENFCGDDYLNIGVEVCEIDTTIACSAIPFGTGGTATCNGLCTEWVTANNCTRTYVCATKPQTDTETAYNTVSNYMQTWNGSAWIPVDDPTTEYNETPSDIACRYKCKEHYSWKSTSCVADTKTLICAGAPANTVYYSGTGSYSYLQTWGGSGWVPPDSSATYSATPVANTCQFRCAANYYWTGSACINTRTNQSCTDLPANAVFYNGTTAYSISQTYTDATGWQPPTTAYYDAIPDSGTCGYKCAANYSWSGSACINTRTNQSCTDLPANAVFYNGTTAYSISQTYTDATGWQPPTTAYYGDGTANINTCEYQCATAYHWDGSACVSNTRTWVCAAKPATGTVWNTVSQYVQTWSGGAWSPTDSITAYNPTGSATSCRYKCDGTNGYVWDTSILKCTKCGDGIPEGNEKCDLGAANGNCSTCRADCTTKSANYCGDGYTCDTEDCDDGNTSNCDLCSSTCHPKPANYCGDTFQCAPEGCDDGNAVTEKCLYGLTLPNETICSSSCGNSPCLVTYCGDGITDGDNGEDCDDGNDKNTDGCRNDCKNNICPDGFVNSGVEDCDDGNDVNTDGCKNDCTDNVCGDGVINTGVEDCDNGSSNNGYNKPCTGNCKNNPCAYADGWYYYGGHCYKYFNTPAGFNTAHDTCQTYSASLVSLSDSGEEDFLHTVFPVPSAGDSASWYWIGLTQEYNTQPGVITSPEYVWARPQAYVVYHGSTGGKANDHVAYPGPDMVFAFAPANTGNYYIKAYPKAASFNATLSIHDIHNGVWNHVNAAGDGAVEASGAYAMTAGRSYYIVVDGVAADDAGGFALEILKDNIQPGWRWLDGTPYSYANWYPGDPNNIDGWENAALKVSPQWQDAKTGGDATLRKYLCEKGGLTVCGDGYKTGSEACDDRNTNNGDGCSSLCAVEGGWTCLATVPTQCFKCGNGIKEAYEQCDDGNTNDTDGCKSDCTVDTANGWICSATQPSVCQKCGNSIPEWVEQCDDGNGNNTDACRNDCRDNICGDGYLNIGVEDCDDGNAVNTDACKNDCTENYCGDGVVWEAPEGAVFLLDLNEGTGSTAYDASGNGNNGTISGATWTAGYEGNALSFEGVDDYFGVPIAELSNQQGTIDYWIKPSGWSGGDGTNHGSFQTKTPGSWGNQAGQIMILEQWGSTNQFYFRIVPDSGCCPTDLSFPATGVFVDDTWVRITVTWSKPNNTISAYVNGSLKVTRTDWTHLTTTPLGSTGYIGVGHDKYQQGVIDKFRIFNRALTSAEISAGALEGNYEACDDGNADNCDTCTTSCTIRGENICGDGYQCGGEQCDDGNTVTEKCAYGLTVPNGTVCSSSCGAVPCLVTYCGDGTIDGDNGEECDDSNTSNCDLCSGTCQDKVANYCGDGYQCGTEGCDDGNTLTEQCEYDLTEPNETVCGASCETGPCEVTYCGDGILDIAHGEQCDDANANDFDDCTNACLLPRCGDGNLDPYEGCDDNNTVTELCGCGELSCTVCDANCALSSGATRYCGDGKIDASCSEVCDDGNSETEICDWAFDQTSCAGCNSTCTVAVGTAQWCGDSVPQVPHEGCDLGAGNNDVGNRPWVDANWAGWDWGLGPLGTGQPTYRRTTCATNCSKYAPHGNIDVFSLTSFAAWACDYDDPSHQTYGVVSVYGADLTPITHYYFYFNQTSEPEVAAACEDATATAHRVNHNPSLQQGYKWMGSDWQFSPTEQVLTTLQTQKTNRPFKYQVEMLDHPDTSWATGYHRPINAWTSFGGHCGDGALQSDFEECDDGNADDCDACHNDCTVAVPNVCGDGHLCGEEECDDGNALNGDGCNKFCGVDPCWICIGEPSVCTKGTATQNFSYTGAVVNWTVPATGICTIEAYGAQGGATGANVGGLGARMRGDFNLPVGTQLKILIGGQGASGTSGGGGGGGSFITYTNNTPLVVAGGGGGGYYSTYSYSSSNAAGVTATTGQSGINASGSTTAGAGGAGPNGGTRVTNSGGGGGGLAGNAIGSYGGLSFTNGGAGGSGGGSGNGGFGGGGGGYYDEYCTLGCIDYRGSGGGGGYGGGGGGGGAAQGGVGGGGGSYNAGTNQSNSGGVRSGNGLVTITCSCAVCGDGVVDPGETCDDGQQNGDYDHCSITCTGLGLRCGDGITQGANGEQCDDGNADDCDACHNDCTTYTGNICGDGHACGAEVCDGANLNGESCATRPAGGGLQTTVTFSYTGTEQAWVVPAGVTNIQIEASGAQGMARTAAGGLGGKATGTATVTPGQTLYIHVGGQSTGYNGGGNAGWSGGKGGGASHIATVSGLLSTLSGNKPAVIIIAGGGGSAGCTSCAGGTGGGTSGGNGSGTYGTGGIGGSPTACGSVCGGFGYGGNGTSVYNADYGTGYGGGGGGGYYGGGGVTPDSAYDDDKGGGGGSGYINTSFIPSDGALTNGVRSGDGLVTITYPARFTGGTLSCNAGCLSFNTSQCFFCGNGTTEPGEQCDDGNTNECDSCHNNCMTNTGNVCGDGYICGGETCDQGGGNVANGDGCSSICQVEAGWTCSGTPSVCAVLPVIIGTGTTTQGYPLNTYYSYVYSAAIYTSAEIGFSATIKKLAWYPTTTSSYSRATKIYLKQTSASTLTSSTWSTLTTGATLVYNATTAGISPANAWLDFTLSPTFSYSNTSNLLVLVEQIYGGGTGYGDQSATPPAVRYSTATSQHEYWQKDTSPPTTAGTVTSNRPNIRISF